jgi:hypothetical protein
MSDLNIPALQRPSFFDGQRLTAADLATVQTFHRELRWLHNRSLHNWGIAFGYAVTGKRDERAVQVQSGYALDCKGRELILGAATEMAIPAVAGDSSGGPAGYYLTVRYAEDEDLTPETRGGVCGASGAVRRPEQPLLRWQEPGDAEHGIDVVLASIEVQNCRLVADVSSAERRDAVPAQQPYVAAGQTKASQTSWRLWPNDETPVGFATTVPTTEAGFRVTPRYQAHVVGERLFVPESNDDVRVNVIVDGYAQVTAATAASFDLVVVLPQGLVVGGGALNPNFVLAPDFMSFLSDELGWHVVWLGIEG